MSDENERQIVLEEMEDKALAIYDQIWGDWSPESDENAYTPFSHAGKVFAMIHYLDSQVENGGFKQWIFNPTGMYVRETRDALIEIGATAVAGLVSRAMSLFPGGCPARDYDERRKLLHQLSQSDDDFLYELGGSYDEERYDLFSTLLRYWEEHGDRPNEPRGLVRTTLLFEPGGIEDFATGTRLLLLRRHSASLPQSVPASTRWRHRKLL